MAVRVLLADDHQIVRDGLRSLLVNNLGMNVVAEAADGRTAVLRSREVMPELVIIDVGLPELNGADATVQILTHCPNARVIALSMHADSQHVGRMLQAGARGYVLKDCAFEELAKAIEEVRAHRLYLSPGVTSVVVDDYVRKLNRTDAEKTTAAGQLTAKEREVLQLVAEGKSTKEVATRLSVSVKTIETHRQNIMNKLNVRSVAELTKFAIREGLTSLE
ncbi:MAG: response regulator [Planctomycetota bacterium]